MARPGLLLLLALAPCFLRPHSPRTPRTPRGAELKQLWDQLWDSALPAGEADSAIAANDVLRSLKRSFDEERFGEEELAGVPVVDAVATGGNFFDRQMENFKRNGPAIVSYFGPLKTLSISDPSMIKFALSQKGSFGKGLLALVAEDIFGKALITASVARPQLHVSSMVFRSHNFGRAAVRQPARAPRLKPPASLIESQ